MGLIRGSFPRLLSFWRVWQVDYLLKKYSDFVLKKSPDFVLKSSELIFLKKK